MAVEVNYNAADSGYSVPEDPNAQRKRDLQDEINELNGKISTLEGYRDAITEAQSNLKKEVIDPISAPYDLQEENKWRGAQYDVAKGMFDTINTNLGDFDGDVTKVVGDIQKAIDELTEKRDAKQAELDSL